MKTRKFRTAVLALTLSLVVVPGVMAFPADGNEIGDDWWSGLLTFMSQILDGGDGDQYVDCGQIDISDGDDGPGGGGDEDPTPSTHRDQ